MTISPLAKIGLGAGGAVLVSSAVIAITAFAAGVPVGANAASPAPKPSDSSKAAAQQYCQVFVNDFAKDLGHNLKASDVQKAAQTAFGQTVDQAVKDGKLTADQATKLKQKAAGGDLCSGMGLAGIDRHGPGMAGGHGEGGAAFLADAAKALGMSQSDLMTALRSGQTVQQIAASKGMNEQQFRDALVAQVKADLDAKVQAKTITQAQEDEALNRLKTGPLPFWSQSMPNHAPRPAGTPTPSTS